MMIGTGELTPLMGTISTTTAPPRAPTTPDYNHYMLDERWRRAIMTIGSVVKKQSDIVTMSEGIH